jgi:hypothetical protein
MKENESHLNPVKGRIRKSNGGERLYASMEMSQRNPFMQLIYEKRIRTIFFS